MFVENTTYIRGIRCSLKGSYLVIERVLYFPILHPSEHSLHNLFEMNVVVICQVKFQTHDLNCVKSNYVIALMTFPCVRVVMSATMTFDLTPVCAYWLPPLRIRPDLLAVLRGRRCTATRKKQSEILYHKDVNPHPVKLVYLNFQPLKVVSRYRDPQPQVVENYPYLFILRSGIYKY